MLFYLLTTVNSFRYFAWKIFNHIWRMVRKNGDIQQIIIWFVKKLVLTSSQI